MTVDQPGLFDDEDPPVRCPTCRGTGTITASHLARILSDAPGQVGRSHPGTSRRAALARPALGTQRYDVLLVLANGNRTAKEIAERLGLSRNQTATRLGELRQGGFVGYLYGEDGERVERPTGPRDAGLVQTITPLGLEALNGR